MPASMKLDEAAVRGMGVGKMFRENAGRINSLHFSADGQLLVSGSDDDSIVIYDCQTGTRKRQVNSKKYGVDLIHLTHAANTAIHSSTKVDDTIRYLSLHDNKYIRYFPGHTKKVVTLAMSPLDDMFLSGSLDKTIRLWDLRSQNCQGLMHLPSRPVAVFDPEGLIFAAGINSQSIKLYDLRSFDKGPFNTFKLPSPEKDFHWTGLQFSPDGKNMLISTNGPVLRLVDAYQGTLSHSLGGHTNPGGLPLEPTFSPDSQFIFCGSGDGSVHSWSAESGRSVAQLRGEAGSGHTGPTQTLLFNPKYLMLASASKELAFWIPGNIDD